MQFLRLLPVIISFLLLGAHFFRAGELFLVALSLALLLLLFARQSWVPRVIQLALLLGAAEWLWTTYVFVQIRSAHGLAWGRMAAILGAVALFTVLSGLVFSSRGLKTRYMADDRKA